jgi:DNA-binding NarL/FixJ family response regulator
VPLFDALSPSLRAVAEGMYAGLSDKEIAQELGISHATARTYAARVLRALGLHNRRDLMRPR